MKGDRRMATRQVRTAAAALLAGCAFGAASAGAADLTLSYQAIVHATEVHDIPVEGEPGHALGMAAFRGLAIFADGRIANHWYAGHFDFQEQSGPIAGHALWVFEDGSTLRASYAGEARAAQDGGIAFTGRHGEITGTGAYAHATGSGTFEGRRVDHLHDGGDTYYRGTLELSVP
jgi:hypothetical protein